MAGIQKDQIDKFFARLSERLSNASGEIYVTGGAALVLYGIWRMTEDIDFEIPEGLDEGVVLAVAGELKVPVQFSSDIERWGMTALADYRERATLYRKFGNLTIKIVEPLNLIAPKLARFLERDIEDVCILIRKFSISRQDLLDHLKKVYERSHASLEKGLFRRQAAQFLRRYQKDLWGDEEALPRWLG